MADLTDLAAGVDKRIQRIREHLDKEIRCLTGGTAGVGGTYRFHMEHAGLVCLKREVLYLKKALQMVSDYARETAGKLTLTG